MFGFVTELGVASADTTYGFIAAVGSTFRTSLLIRLSP
jgi:hypothetical protein